MLQWDSAFLLLVSIRLNSFNILRYLDSVQEYGWICVLQSEVDVTLCFEV